MGGWSITWQGKSGNTTTGGTTIDASYSAAIVITSQLPLIDALLAAWLPGTEGQGVGDANYDPLFGYGFGLTY